MRVKVMHRAPRNASSVEKAKRIGLNMFGNVYDHIGRTRDQIKASVDSARRDKGHILVDAGAAIEQKRVNFYRNNTGANLQPEYGPFPDTAQGTVQRVRQAATNALTSEPVNKVRDFLAMDPAGENVDQTQLNMARAAAYGIPMTVGGASLLGLMTMHGGAADQQPSSQISMSEEQRKKEENDMFWAAAALGTGALGGGGIIGYNARPRV